jgi:hypothetical protein
MVSRSTAGKERHVRRHANSLGEDFWVQSFQKSRKIQVSHSVGALQKQDTWDLPCKLIDARDTEADARHLPLARETQRLIFLDFLHCEIVEQTPGPCIRFVVFICRTLGSGDY